MIITYKGKMPRIVQNCYIAPNATIPPNTLVFGRPAKVIRELTQQEIERIRILCKRVH
nr:hypothetical protein [Caldicellulosiruptor changbaiensis]